MEITGLQIIFILSALAEWIFTESTEIMRGYLAEGWEMPAGLACARFVGVVGILYAYYIGGRLIYRKKSGGSRVIVVRRGGVLWAFLFYVPYLAYSFAGNMLYLFKGKGRAEGVVFFLINLLVFVWLGVKLYKMPRERKEAKEEMETETESDETY